MVIRLRCFVFFSSRRRHTRLQGDWSSDVCSSDLPVRPRLAVGDGAQRYADAVESWTGRRPEGLDTIPAIAASLLALAEIEEVTRALEIGRASCRERV